MKNIIISTLMVLFFTSGIKAQDVCSQYYPMKKGTTFQMKVYDRKDKLSTTIDYSVLDSKKTGSSQTATIEAATYDDKNELISTINYDVTCDGDKLSIDFNSLISPEIYEQYKDMEIDISGTNIELPNNLSVGQTLPDANVLMNIKVTPLNMKLSIDIVNRKVEAKENVTTAAGTFECFVISYESEFKMGLRQQLIVKEWWSEGIGVVKTETYNKKGKPMGRTEMSKFSK